MTPDEAVGKEVWVGLGARQWKVDNYRIFFVKSIKDSTIYLKPSALVVSFEDRGVLYPVPLEDIRYILDVDTGLTMDELHGLYWDLEYANEISEEQGQEATESGA